MITNTLCDFPSQTEPGVERKMVFAHPAAPERLKQSVGSDLRRRDKAPHWFV
jgi:hypothetical protein